MQSFITQKNWKSIAFYHLLFILTIVLFPPIINAQENQVLEFSIPNNTGTASMFHLSGFVDGAEEITLRLLQANEVEVTKSIPVQNFTFNTTIDLVECRDGDIISCDFNKVIIEAENDPFILVAVSLFPQLVLAWTEEPQASGYRVAYLAESQSSSFPTWSIDVGTDNTLVFNDLLENDLNKDTIKLTWFPYDAEGTDLPGLQVPLEINIEPVERAAIADISITSSSRKARILIRNMLALEVGISIKLTEIKTPSVLPSTENDIPGAIIGGGSIEILHRDGTPLAKSEYSQIGLDAEVIPGVTHLLSEYSLDELKLLSESDAIKLHYYDGNTEKWNLQGSGLLVEKDDNQSLGMNLKGDWLLSPANGVYLEQLYPYWVYVVDSSYTINLIEGWNLITFPNQKESQLVEDILDPIKENLKSIWKWNKDQWEVWSPNNSYNNLLNSHYNSLSSVAPQTGYWLKMESPATLIIDQPTGDSHRLPALNQGWNLIGTDGTNDELITTSLLNFTQDVTQVWAWQNRTWKIWLRDKTNSEFNNEYGTHFDELTTLERGDGYWFHCGADIPNIPPVVQLDIETDVEIGSKIYLTPGETKDINGDTLSFSWTITPPLESEFIIEETETELFMDNLGDYQIKLTVSDGTASETAQANITSTLVKLIEIENNDQNFFMDQNEVTNAQFNAFIEDSNGYLSEDNWSSEGWQWRINPTQNSEVEETPSTGPFGWDQSRTPPYSLHSTEDFNESGLFQPNNPILRYSAQTAPPLEIAGNTFPNIKDEVDLANSPVIGVSWYEADAFCRWANKRLPTSEEWLVAGQGESSRTYPWGEEEPYSESLYRVNLYSPDLSDSDGYQYNAPVRSFVDGNTPEGVYDLAGNVKEWIADSYLKNKIAKGGSWRSISLDLLKNTNNFYYEPFSRDIDLGFRCVK